MLKNTVTKREPKHAHRVKRAVIMAAGRGKRLYPLTQDIPKPLIQVHGQAMIESVITTLHKNGIHEIYVVVGYKKEQFDYLQEKYLGLTIIENPHYATCNNISSLYVAREHLEEAIILDADQIIKNKEVLHPVFHRSGYCSFWQEKDTEEWLLELDGDIVSKCSRTGGKRGWQLQSVSFWSAEDGKRLRKDVEEAFMEKNIKNLYWDDIALFVYPDHYQLGIREIKEGDIIEIDSYDELVEEDDSYPRLKEATFSVGEAL